MNLRLSAIALLAAAATLAGCRRADIREFTVEIPDLTPANTSAIAKSLEQISGTQASRAIYCEDLKWDFDKKTLTLRYDSMLTAKTNIRMAIESAGVAVKYPEKTGPAGYIDTRE